MGEGSAYNLYRFKRSNKESGLEEKDISNEKTGIVMGSGGPSIKNVYFAVDTIRKSSPKKMGPYIVPRTMASTCSATLAVPFKIKGVNYSISSACATSGHCIGNGMELIQYGKQDIVFAGGGEELDWALSGMFDAMPALSSKYNSTQKKHQDLMTQTEMDLLLQEVVELLFLKNMSMQKPEEQKYMLN